MQVKTSDGYDNLYPQTSINNVQGIQDQYYDKEAIISNNTLTSLGLSESSTPDDVFQLLGRFNNNSGNEYLWIKQFQSAELSIGDPISVQLDPSVPPYTITVYSQAIANTDGTVSLGGESYTYPVPSGETISNDAIGKYYMSNNQVMQITNIEYLVGNYNKVTGNSINSIVSTSISYVNSPDSDAYPIEDGNTYYALGQLGGFSHIEIGSYIGNGKYGKSNPNTLIFNFTPKFWGILTSYVPGVPYDRFSPIPDRILLPWGETLKNPPSGNEEMVIPSYDGNKVSWYSNRGQDTQCNNNNYVYYYFAIA